MTRRSITRMHLSMDWTPESFASPGRPGPWFLGHPDLALEKIEKALALAGESFHPLSSAVALFHASGIRCARGEGPAAQQHAEAALALCTEQGFPNFLGQATVHLGAALATQGKMDEGIALIRDGLAACRATGAVLHFPHFIALLAEACRTAMRFDEGLTALAEATEIAERTGERFYESERYRLKGELMILQRSGAEAEPGVEREAEECFWKAIEIARRQQAKSLELRAVMSLSRLWQRQSKKDETRRMLAELYGWFSEGFDTKDLKEAKALLERLS
jgi:predicted ATPase